MRPRHAVLPVLVCCLAAAPPASAGEARSQGDDVFATFAGPAADVVVTEVAARSFNGRQFGGTATFRISDAAAPLTAGPGCVPVDAHTVVCTAVSSFRPEVAVNTVGTAASRVQVTAVTALAYVLAGGGPDVVHMAADGHVQTETGDDVVTVDAPASEGARTLVLAGGGDDEVVVAPGNRSTPVVVAGAGDDVVTASAATSGTIEDGPGDDVVRASSGPGPVIEVQVGDGDDAITGGAVAYRFSPVTVRLDGRANDGAPGEADDIVAPASVTGTRGADTLLGGPGPDRLLGGGGDDVLEGGPGADHLDGGEGDDLVRARDGEADAVVATAGQDRLRLDPIDVVTGPALGA